MKLFWGNWPDHGIKAYIINWQVWSEMCALVCSGLSSVYVQGHMIRVCSFTWTLSVQHITHCCQ